MVAFSRFLGFFCLLCMGIPSFAQKDSLALSEEYYKLGMEVFDYTHRAQAKELFVLSTQMVQQCEGSIYGRPVHHAYGKQGKVLAIF